MVPRTCFYLVSVAACSALPDAHVPVLSNVAPLQGHARARLRIYHERNALTAASEAPSGVAQRRAAQAPQLRRAEIRAGAANVYCIGAQVEGVGSCCRRRCYGGRDPPARVCMPQLHGLGVA